MRCSTSMQPEIVISGLRMRCSRMGGTGRRVRPSPSTRGGAAGAPSPRGRGNCSEASLGHSAVFGDAVDAEIVAIEAAGDERHGAAADEWVEDETAGRAAGKKAR